MASIIENSPMDRLVTLIFPEQKNDELSDHLVRLTKTIADIDPEVVAHGFLGGEHGYGARWDNDVFMMHPFCWCEKDDCPWCGGCTCDPDTTEYFIDGLKVTRDEHWKWFTSFAGPYPHELHRHGTPEFDAYDKQWHARIDERNSRSKEVAHPHCDYCTGRGAFATRGAKPSLGAPNFWHKQSGFQVRWYKSIGRDMKVQGNPSSLDALFDACTASLEGEK